METMKIEVFKMRFPDKERYFYYANNHKWWMDNRETPLFCLNHSPFFHVEESLLGLASFLFERLKKRSLDYDFELVIPKNQCNFQFFRRARNFFPEKGDNFVSLEPLSDSEIDDFWKICSKLSQEM